ncbi:MAG TPA: sigma-70 family RNA polymerase sigma factor [Mycobacteriales bacterium]|nr:sigma-70 family RNA polymerase sigma factor [Mycobacteriales bacterium]
MAAPLDDAVAAAAAGDERAFTTLYRAVQPPLLRYLRVVEGAAAEDIAAEAWLEVARRISSFSGDEAGFRAWIFTIARSKAVDRIRREARRPVEHIEDMPGLDPSCPDDVAERVVSVLTTHDALRLIATLPPDQAEVVTLRVIADLDVSTVAAMTGKSPGAVRVAQHRGLRRLAAMLSSTSPPLPWAPAGARPA